MESGPFTAEIVVSALPGGSVALGYTATSPEGDELHREHTIVSAGFDQRDRLFIAHAESPFVTVLVQTEPGSGRFEVAEAFGPYDMAIVVEQSAPDVISYAWHWAPSGQPTVEQSRAVVKKQA